MTIAVYKNRWPKQVCIIFQKGDNSSFPKITTGEISDYSFKRWESEHINS